MNAGDAAGIGGGGRQGRVVGQAVARVAAGVVEQTSHQCGRQGVAWCGLQRAQTGWVERLATNLDGDRVSRCDDAGVPLEQPAHDQFLQALHDGAELAVVAVEVHAVDRVDADQQAAVDQVARDAHPRQRAGLEAVGVGASATQRGVIAQVSPHQQVQPACRAAYLQQLQPPHCHITRGIALGDELGQRVADVHPPGRCSTASVDAVGAAMHAPQATGEGAAHLHAAQGVAAGHARQKQICGDIAGGRQRLQACGLDAAGPRCAAGPVGHRHADIGRQCRQAGVTDRASLEAQISAAGHGD